MIVVLHIHFKLEFKCIFCISLWTSFKSLPCAKRMHYTKFLGCVLLVRGLLFSSFYIPSFFPPCIVCDPSRRLCSVSCLNRRSKSKQQLKFLWFCHSALLSAASQKRRSPLAAGTLISESQWNNNNSDINEAGRVRANKKALCKNSFYRAQLSWLTPQTWYFLYFWCLCLFLSHPLFVRHVYYILESETTRG